MRVFFKERLETWNEFTFISYLPSTAFCFFYRLPSEFKKLLNSLDRASKVKRDLIIADVASVFVNFCLNKLLLVACKD